jgi:hypothetical protein
MRLIPSMGLGPRRAAARGAESLIMTAAVAIGTMAVALSVGMAVDMERDDRLTADSSLMNVIWVSQYRDEKWHAVIDESTYARTYAQAISNGVPEAWFKDMLGKIPPVRTAFLQYSCAASLRLPGATDWLVPDMSRMSGPGVFSLPEVRLVAGRFYSEEEFFSAAPVIVIGQNVARRLLGGADPLGRTIEVRPYSWIDYTYSAVVIGVTAQSEAPPGVLAPEDWIALTKVHQDYGPMAMLAAKQPQDSPRVAAAVRALIAAGGPSLASLDADTRYESFTAVRRTNRALEAGSIGISLLTLLISLWSIGSLFTARLPSFRAALSLLRALGARRRDVVATCLSELAPVSLTGIAAGAAGTAAVRAFVMKRAAFAAEDALVLAVVAAVSLALELLQVLPVLGVGAAAALRREGARS